MANQAGNANLPTKLTLQGHTFVERLGRGASGSTWRIQLDGRSATLKLGHPNTAEQLASEAERLVVSASESLPQLLDVGRTPAGMRTPDGPVEDATPYLLLSYAPGQSLQQLLLTQPDEQLAGAVAQGCAAALADLHSAGLAHGDIKPANVIVERQDEVLTCRVIDLGLAQEGADANLRGATPRYLPPDLSGESHGAARDLWALGLTLLETLSAEARQDEQLNLNHQRYLQELTPAWRPLLQVLLGPPEARPSAAWLVSQLRSPQAQAGSKPAATVNASSLTSLRRSYLATRMSSLHRVARGIQPDVRVAGIPGKWLQECCQLLQRISALRSSRSEQVEAIKPLSELQLRRWLVQLLGVRSVDFPQLPELDEPALVKRLLELSESQPLETVTLAALTSRDAALPQPAPVPSSPADLALQLGAETPSIETLNAVEQLVVSGQATERVALRLSEALRQRHELGRALFALQRPAGDTEPPMFKLQRASILLRGQDSAAAERVLADLESASEPEVQSKRAALLCRIALARGDLEGAARALRDSAPGVSPELLQAQASLELTSGQLDAAEQTLVHATSLTQSTEQQAKSHALLANLAQQRGDSGKAFALFRKAAEHAARAGAILEECTYLVGVAATASGLGLITEALGASKRSALLYQHLNRTPAAARAWLARASAYAMVGAQHEARSAAFDTLDLARAAGDQRCRAFAHLLLSDITDSSEAGEHLQRTQTLLLEVDGELRSDDRLRIAARQLREGELPPERLLTFDGLAAEQPSVDVRLEWWGNRARAALQARSAAELSSEQGEPIVTTLLALTHADATVEAKGQAFAYGAGLAAQLGDGESARQLSLAASEAYRTLLNGTPAELHASLRQLQWVKLIHAPQQSDISPDQLADIQTLIAGLSDRSQLKALLNRILDALVLWTGVERGLLLLTAPGGQLVPRAARNLARADLAGEQLRLSTSLAERALETREFVVAVDAAGELPELHESVHSLRLRSVLAVPLLARGEVLGVAYLDDRMRRGAFGKRELSWVRLVASLAAVAIADAKDQLRLRRAVRKAQRAESRLARTLAEREAALTVAQQELAHSKNARGTRFSYGEIVGNSDAIRHMLRLLDRVATSDVPVLISGESGSGKELVARAVHRNSARSRAAFVTENCSAIPESLLESTLFGHVKGAFTGASRQRAGLFEVAHQGTLFLDEIADMSLAMQAKLLRVLESGEVRRVGAERPITVDVRVVAASHKDLEQQVRAGRFREDLLYRLNVITIGVPALRERKSDIPLLVRHFVDKHAPARPGKRGPSVQFDDEAMQAMMSFDWPGNVRQLENETRRALVLADGNVSKQDLSPQLRGLQTQPNAGLDLKQRVDSLEKELLSQALDQTSGNQTRAAQLLGISRFGLQKMMKRLGVTTETRAGQSKKAAVTDN